MNNICGVSCPLSTVLFQEELCGQHRIYFWARLIFSCIYVGRTSVLGEVSMTCEDSDGLVEIILQSLKSSSETSDYIYMRRWRETHPFFTSCPAKPQFGIPGAWFFLRNSNLGKEDKRLWYSMIDNKNLILIAHHPGRFSPFLPIGFSP